MNNRLKCADKVKGTGTSKRILPVFIPQEGCRHSCVYCDQYTISGYRRPPDLAGIGQAISSLPGDGYQLAFYGGSFTALSAGRQLEYLSAAGEWLRSGRLSGIRVSTRPDYIDGETLLRLKKHGVGCVELGVQSLDGEVLAASGRGYDETTVINAIQMLKEHGFETGVQLMPGLPFDTCQKSIGTALKLASLSPDSVRIYPALVLKNTGLVKMYEAGVYEPLSLDAAVELCLDLTAVFVTHDIPVIRMGLNPSPSVEDACLAGPYHPAFGQLVFSALCRKLLESLLKDWQGSLCLYVHKNEVSSVIGYKGDNKHWLQERFGKGIRIKAADAIGKGNIGASRSAKHPPEILVDKQRFLLQYMEQIREKQL